MTASAAQDLVTAKRTTLTIATSQAIVGAAAPVAKPSVRPARVAR